MAKKSNSTSRVRRLNQRQRKKLHLAEFQEFVFDVKIKFRSPMDVDGLEPLLEDLFDFVESKGMLVAGMGGSFPVVETECYVQQAGRGSPSEEDRQTVTAWFKARPEVESAEAGDFVDGWHGYDD